MCGPRGAWSGQQPVCAAPGDTCLVQRLATSGHVTLDTELQVGTREWHECTGPLQLSPAPPGQCPPLRSVARGWDWSVGASLQVECQPG